MMETIETLANGLDEKGQPRVWSGRVSVAGISSPYIESGPMSDVAVVFVHGNPGSSEDWRDLIGQVGQFARAIAFDLPGFGKADKPKDFDYTVEGYARHIDGALRHLGVHHARLVLHDFGGAFGLAWASQNPERVASITLVNIGVLPGYRWHYLARIWRAPLLGEIFMATATRFGFRMMLKHGNPRGLPKAFVDGMFDNFDKRTRRAVLRLYRATPERAIEEMGERLRDLDWPALVIWGAEDPYVPVRFAEKQRLAFPRAEVSVLDRSGHWPYADDPQAFARLLLPFLRRQTSGPSARQRELAAV